MAEANIIKTELDALTREQFYAFLQQLHLDSDQAALKYEALHWKLVRFFVWSSCSAPEDLADETLNRVARKVHEGHAKIVDVEAFAWGVAKHVRQEEQKRNGRTVRLSAALDERFASDGGAVVAAIHEKLQRQKELRCLHACLKRLPREEKELFLAYRVSAHHYLEKRRHLAEQLGLTPGALRVRVLRTRAKLEKCLGKCVGK